MLNSILFRFVLPFLLVVLIGFLGLYPQLFRCLRIKNNPSFHAEKNLPKVFVHNTATATQQRKLHDNLLNANERIRLFWGSKEGHATLIYCPKQADYQQYCSGGDGAGCSIGMPWGDSYLILGPDGNNVDVIAHEFCHDELFARLGWWCVKREIPQWFNEGLALSVDYRFLSTESFFSSSSRPLLKLSELETTRDFFGKDETHTLQAYLTAIEEVHRWLAIVGQDNLKTLLKAIQNGKPFLDTYQRLEREERNNQRQNPTH